MVKKTEKYENNPFVIGLSGINVLIDNAKGVAILFFIISIGSALFSFATRGGDKPDTASLPAVTSQDMILFGGLTLVIILAAVFIGSLLSAMSAYTSAQLAHGKQVAIKDAFQIALDYLPSYIWLQIIVFVKTFLWSLLFIIPGIIMANRYSLANVVFFDKDLNGNAAVKESIRLTRGAWLTTFAGQALFNFVTFGSISEVLTTASRTILYRQLDALRDKEKPKAHILSWLTLIIPFALIGLILMLVITAGVLAAIYKIAS